MDTLNLNRLITFLILISLTSCFEPSEKYIKEKQDECLANDSIILNDVLINVTLDKNPYCFYYKTNNTILQMIKTDTLYQKDNFFCFSISQILNKRDTLTIYINQKEYIITDFEKGIQWGGNKILGCELYSVVVNGKKQNNKSSIFL